MEAKVFFADVVEASAGRAKRWRSVEPSSCLDGFSAAGSSAAFISVKAHFSPFCLGVREKRNGGTISNRINSHWGLPGSRRLELTAAV